MSGVAPLDRGGDVFVLHLGGGQRRFNADSVDTVSALLNDEAATTVPRARDDPTGKIRSNGLDPSRSCVATVETVKRVRWHLRNVYRKLDIRSRGELPAALGPGP